MSKHRVNCPGCGSYALHHTGALGTHGYVFRCSMCLNAFTERDLLEHMRERPGIDRDAPAFRCLDRPKPKARSLAARIVFDG
jgi:transposase-like protein